MPKSHSSRVRDEAYLKTVRGEPCLVCGKDGEAHHITTAEPKAMAMKVGDNWTVPLCHPHHMQLHAHGNEIEWWALQGVEPTDWAITNYANYQLAKNPEIVEHFESINAKLNKVVADSRKEIDDEW